ncbi:MAG: hypothetical protein ACK4N1_05675 [Pseudorhizobium sp.]
MKTPQRNFTVEFKSGRRRSGSQPASIWGNTDLKALVRKAEEDAPHLFDSSVDRAAEHESGEMRKPTPVVPRILESAKREDAQPVARTQAETVLPELADVASTPPAAPAPRFRIAAKRGVRAERDGRASPRSAARLKKTKPLAAQVPSFAKEPVDDLASLEDENRRLRTMLSHRLLQQNRQLRQMLLRFNEV